MVFVKIYDFMFCELKYAKKYTECAIMYKTNNDIEMYNTCIKLAEAELSHAEIWHNMSDTKIKKHIEKIQTDEYLRAFIEDKEAHFLHKYAKVKYMLESAKK